MKMQLGDGTMQTQPQGHDIRRLASMARGAGCRGNYPPPVEGEKCSLTSPFIEPAIALTILFPAANPPTCIWCAPAVIRLCGTGGRRPCADPNAHRIIVAGCFGCQTWITPSWRC